MLNLYYSNKFKKDYKLMMKRNVNIDDFKFVINELINERPLDEKYRDHNLEGNWKGFRECHINPDWLLIYRIDNNDLILTLARTGTHSDLF